MLDPQPRKREPIEGLRSVRAQGSAKEFLQHALVSGRLATALLFEGPEGVGKERCARALAQCSVCLSRLPDGDACGRCATCRAIDAEKYPDVIVLARTLDVLTQQEQSGNELKSEIVVEKIRELQRERLVYLPHGSTRWIIVRDAHELNASSSNALLKTLEEPPANTHFVLVTHRPSELLVTVRSRCQRVRFAPLPEAEVISILSANGVEPALAKEAAKWAEGSAGRAVAMSDPALLASRKGWLDRLIQALRASKPGAIVDVAEAFSKDASAREGDEVLVVLEMLERYFRDEAISAATDARRSSIHAARSQLVRQTIASLDSNLKAQMAVESMLVRLRDVR
jgi:DNA polymerase-3 subunit delta'